jgi:hypothetical protein
LIHTQFADVAFIHVSLRGPSYVLLLFATQERPLK